MPSDSLSAQPWSQLTVRTSRAGQCMVVPMLNAQTLTEEELENEKISLKSFFASELDFPVSSLYLQYVVEKKQGEENAEKYEKLHGDDVIVETLNVNELSLNFKISPNAFFQINPSAAESLYKSVCDHANVDENTVLLDICCGTGTIGMCLASKVKQVIGIELVESAVENARRSAVENNISNIKFIRGTAESVLPTLTSSLPKEHKSLKIVAIIDPPRAGLKASFIKTLRASREINHLIYVSCEPKLAKQNLIDLCRPASKAYFGNPFVPIKAIPVDMFPQTDKCEIIFVYERLSSNPVDVPS